MEHNTEHDTTELQENPLYRRPSLWRSLGIAGACLAVAVPVVGLASYGIAGADSADDSPEEEVVEECGELTPEEIADSNEEQDALAAFLDERGIAHTREADEDGIRWVVWDENDEAANDAADEFYAQRYPLSPEDLAAGNAEEDALAAFLDERGIHYTRDTGADGVRLVDWDENDDAANQAVAEFYAARYPLAEEARARMNAQEDELAAFLDERGIHYTREADAEGVSYVVWDENDEAANAAVDEFYESQPDHSCVGMVEVG